MRKTIDFKKRKWVIYGGSGWPVFITPFAIVPSQVFVKKYGIENEGVALWKQSSFEWLYDEYQLIKISKKMLPHLLKKKWGYYKNWKKTASSFNRMHYKVITSNLKILSTKKLKNLLERYYTLFVKEYAASNLLEPISFYFQKYLKTTLISNGIIEGEAEKLIHEYGMPVKKSYLKICAEEYGKAKSTKEILRLIKKYHYIKNDFLGQKLVKEADLKKLFNKLKKEELPKQINDLKYGVEVKNLLTVLQIMATLQDCRKEQSLMWISGAEYLLKEYGKRIDIDYKDLLTMTFNQVLTSKFDKEKVIKSPEFIIDWNKDGEIIIEGEEAKKIFLAYSKFISDKGTNLKGVVASKGIVQGRVVVVTNTSQFKKVRKGSILVSIMTRPEYLPVMEIAAAFITDEGGVTSHAAITAREMHKPCIVGTQTATKILKDGDLVEVDAEKGLIRKLN